MPKSHDRNRNDVTSQWRRAIEIAMRLRDLSSRCVSEIATGMASNSVENKGRNRIFATKITVIGLTPEYCGKRPPEQ